MIPLTRRQLIGSFATAATASAASLGKAKPRFGLARVSAISDELATAPGGDIAFAKLYNMQWLELRNVPGQGIEYSQLDEAKLKQAAAGFKENGIRISFLNTGMLKFSLPGTEIKTSRAETDEQKSRRAERDAARFKDRFQYLEKSIRAAHALGVTDVRVFAFLRTNDPAKHYPRVAEIIGEMALTAEREGVRLLLENETSCNAATCEESAQLLKMIPSKAVGLNWDVLNGFDMKEEAFPHGYSLLPKQRIWNVQAKGKSLLEEGKIQDWPAILRALLKDGYKGCIGLENHMFGRMQFTNAHYEIRELIRIAESV
jgi:L-ribulose-5-phosphate 3-epimerase